MIGGATTSKAHTAVKIEPQYHNDTVIYVADASRAVGVASALVSKDNKAAFTAKTKAEYVEVRERSANRTLKKPLVPLQIARKNKLQTDWKSYQPPRPTFIGTRVLENYPLEKLVDAIDWTPFFISWELAGKYPRIFDDAVIGNEARELFDNAQALLKTIVDQKLLRANAVFGLWPAAQINDDDIAVFADEARTQQIAVLHQLRQQQVKPDALPQLCLADYVAPLESGINDYVGAFAVTTGIGVDELVAGFQAKHDDYNAIMVKALADRLAEAFAEHLHLRVRKEFWGYAAAESLDNDALIREQYRGIRPAPGYPACPDHSEKSHAV